MNDAVVLVVDDDRSIRMILISYLKKQGVTQTLEAENGALALELLRSNWVDLVLLDIMMPEMDGDQVLSVMKSDRQLRHIPVIMITALDDMKITARCIERGAEDYLVKPFNPVMMRARVAASLEKKRLRDVEQEYLRTYDAETGLPNRQFFIRRLTGEIQRSRRHPNLFGILLIRLGNYHMLTVSLGKKAADEYLSERAKLLTDILSNDGSVLARAGDNLFAVLLVGLNFTAQGDAVAVEVHRRLSESMSLQGHDISGRISIGVVYNNPDYTGAESMMRDAELAARRIGPLGGFQIFDEAMHREAMRRLDLEPELRNALKNNHLALYYQPIIRLEDQSIVGFEALVRWLHPEKGIIPPDQFIRTAEETGLIVPIGTWVLQEACRQAARWGHLVDKYAIFSISVNLSAHQLIEPDFLDILEQALKEADIPGHRIKLELTETALIENPDRTEQILKEVNRFNIKTCLDDFGTGYCSLHYLLRYSFSTLKIDRSLISQIGEQPRSRNIIGSTINLAHQLGMDVVAEGVETPQQAEALRSMDCEYGQGQHFNHPLPHDKASDLLK